MKNLKILFLSPLLACLLASLAPSAWPATFAFNESQSATADASVSTLALPAINVAAGSLVIACFKAEAGASTLDSMTGGDTLTLLTAQAHSTGPRVRCGYKLSATGNASYVITATWNAGITFRRGIIMEFTYSGTASLDVEASASTEDDNDSTPSSAAVTTTGTDEVCIGFHGDFTTQVFSSETINGQARDGVVQSSDADMWYELFSATFSSGAASLTRTQFVDRDWVQRLQCFKAGGVTSNNLGLMGVGK